MPNPAGPTGSRPSRPSNAAKGTIAPAASARAARHGRSRRRKKGPWPGALLAVFLAMSVVLPGWLLVRGGRNGWGAWLAAIRSTPAAAAAESPPAEDPDDNLPPYTVAELPKLSYFGDGEAELGEFSIRLYDPAARVTWLAEFKLEGKTLCAGPAAFQDFVRQNYRFVREQVMVALRCCDGEELSPQELRLLERKIAARINLALGREFVESVAIKDFAVFEAVDNAAFHRRSPPTPTTKMAVTQTAPRPTTP